MSSSIFCNRFAHLINIEFFADLLNVLNELMVEGSLKLRESLHCVQVVFTILSDQGEVLSLDPHRFFKYLYVNMFSMNAGESLLNAFKEKYFTVWDFCVKVVGLMLNHLNCRYHCDTLLPV